MSAGYYLDLSAPTPTQGGQSKSTNTPTEGVDCRREIQYVDALIQYSCYRPL